MDQVDLTRARADRTGPDALRSRIDRELLVIDGAIAAVAGGVGRRVLVGGLRLSGPILEAARARAARAGVRIEILTGLDEEDADLVLTPWERP
jgi:hypothetical protein